VEDLRLKRYCSYLILFVLVPLCLFPSQNSANASQAIIVVPDDCPTIQAAIDAANSGGTINVRNGTYSENLVLNKSLLLIGENAETTIVDGGPAGGWVLTITADNITVTGFTLRSLAPTRNIGLGIYASNCNVSKNVITNNWGGIQLRGKSNILSENTVIDNEHYGIEADSSSNNSILKNNVRGGIRLSDSSSNSLTENNCDGITLVFSSNNNNLTGNALVGGGLSIFSSFGTLAEDNSVNGKPLIYLEDASGQLIEDAGQVSLVSCKDMLVRNLTNADIELHGTNNTEITANHEVHVELFAGSNNNIITENNECTIRLDSSSNNYIANNRISNNSDGIYLAASWNNHISENNVTTNDNGVRLLSSSNNTISQNRITGSVYSGIDLSFSSNNNKITENNISNNDIGVYLSYSSNGNNISGNSITENRKSGTTIGYRVPESVPEQGGCSANSVFENNIADNSCGIQIIYSSNTTVFHNNFEQNNVQIYTDHSLSTCWDNGYPSGGNYWSSYTHVDENNGPNQNITGPDGIWDHPYNLSASDVDHYPLVGRITIPEFPSMLLLPIFILVTSLVVKVCRRRHFFSGHRTKPSASASIDRHVNPKSLA
jgi:parallel beta-helix repeat protein